MKKLSTQEKISKIQSIGNRSPIHFIAFLSKAASDQDQSADKDGITTLTQTSRKNSGPINNSTA